MKKASKVLGAMLALCLLISLPFTPALAEPAKFAYQEQFAKTGGWPPELIGSWVGYYVNFWGMFTFYPNGRYDMTVFELPILNESGTSKTLESPDESIVEGSNWHLRDNGYTGDFRKVSMPYVRLNAEEETASEWVDKEIIGTFGGKMNGVYIEWTFHGDGRFTQVTPYEDLRENGTFFNGNGVLSILLGGKVITCSYRMTPNLALEGLPDIDRLNLSKRTGPLVQVPNQWTMR